MSDGADEDDDVAFVVVGTALADTGLAGTARVHGVRERVGQAVGGQQIEFGDRAAAEAVFGYPSEPPYTGQDLDYCEGTLQPDPFGTQDEGIACAMTEGGSGGPWLSEFHPRTGFGVITGVTTFRYSGQDRILYSADLGPVAQALLRTGLVLITASFRTASFRTASSITGPRSGGPGRSRWRSGRPRSGC